MTELSSPGRSSSESSWGFWLVVIFGIFVVYNLLSPRVPSLKKGTLVPTVRWERIADGQPVAFDWKGQITVLHFWATWCGACKSELHHATQRAYALSKQGIRYLLVNLDQPSSSSSLRSFLSLFRIPSTWLTVHVRDPLYQAVSMFRVSVFPSLVILNTQGQVAFYVQGILPDDSLQHLVKKLQPSPRGT